MGPNGPGLHGPRWALMGPNELPWALDGPSGPGPSGLGPHGPPWAVVGWASWALICLAIMGKALMRPNGPVPNGLGPYVPPWALVGQAILGLDLMSRAHGPGTSTGSWQGPWTEPMGRVHGLGLGPEP